MPDDTPFNMALQARGFPWHGSISAVGISFQSIHYYRILGSAKTKWLHFFSTILVQIFLGISRNLRSCVMSHKFYRNISNNFIAFLSCI